LRPSLPEPRGEVPERSNGVDSKSAERHPACHIRSRELGFSAALRLPRSAAVPSRPRRA